MNYFIFTCELTLPQYWFSNMVLSLGSFSFNQLITHQFIHSSIDHIKSNILNKLINFSILLSHK